MKTIRILNLLLAVLLFASCNRTEKTAVQETGGVNARSLTPKLIRSQGSNEYAEVRCGLQDRAGNLWFGTTGEGVYCYDGKGFAQFTVHDGLADNTVWSILEDKKGTIWFGTDCGLSRWDGKSICNIPIVGASGLSESTIAGTNQTHSGQPNVWSLHEDKRGTIWIGTNEGMFCYADEVFSEFLKNDKVKNPGGLRLKMVDCILEDRKGDLWFASGMRPGMEGLCRFDGTSVISFKPAGEKWIRTVLEAPSGDVWLGTRHRGVWRYDGTSFSRWSEPAGLGMPLLVDRSGNIWFSGEEGANAIESKTGIWRYDGKTFRNFFTKEGMGNFGVWCMLEDRDGNIWVGTRNLGLYRYDGKSFTCYSE